MNDLLLQVSAERSSNSSKYRTVNFTQTSNFVSRLVPGINHHSSVCRDDDIDPCQPAIDLLHTHIHTYLPTTNNALPSSNNQEHREQQQGQQHNNNYLTQQYTIILNCHTAVVVVSKYLWTLFGTQWPHGDNLGTLTPPSLIKAANQSNRDFVTFFCSINQTFSPILR